MSLRVEVLSTESAFGALEAEWDAIAKAQTVRLPFTTPQWNRIWWHALAERSGGMVRDSLRIHAVRETNGGALVAGAPFMVTERPARGPLRARTIQFLGADPNITELRAAVCAPGRDAECVQTLLQELTRGGRRWDWALWGGVTPEQAPALEAWPGMTWTRDMPVYLLDLKPTWDEFRAGLKSNIKESLRKCYNSLKRDNLTFAFEPATTESAVLEGLEHFFRLHAARAQVTDSTVMHRDVFAFPAAREFLREYCRHSVAAGECVVFVLRISDQVVATRIGFVLGDSIYMYFSGYDPAWGKYSVMTTLVAEAIKWSIERGLQMVNLSFGTDVSKTRWGPRELLFRDAMLPSRTRRGQLAYSAFQRLSQMRESPRARRLIGWMARSRG